MTPPRAARMITIWALAITLVSGTLMHVVDSREFPSIGRGLWWAAQTVTTVGYGDAVPTATGGRILAFVVMLNAIGLIAVVSGVVTAAMIEAARERRTRDVLTAVSAAELGAKLERIERLLEERAEARA